MKESLIKARRQFSEIIGVERYSRPALFGLDEKLEKYLFQRNSFFIEAGANDGFSQSNTYYLERFKGWRGILIEAIPELFDKCVKERTRSRVFNNALVSSDYRDSHLTLNYANLMTVAEGAMSNKGEVEAHLKEGLRVQPGTRTYQVQVPVRTLTSILEECGVDQIDFFSLDVEGFEVQVLRGLDFERFRPTYILVEALNDLAKVEIDSFLSSIYENVDQLTKHDYLYRLKGY